MGTKDEIIQEAKVSIGKSYVDIMQRSTNIRFRISFSKPEGCNCIKDLGVPLLDMYLIGEVYHNAIMIFCYYIQV